MGGIANSPDFAQAVAQATLEAKVERLTKLVHILWKEAERLESIVQVTPGGLLIKTGSAEVSVKKDGGIVISGRDIALKSMTDIDIKGQRVRINGEAV